MWVWVWVARTCPHGPHVRHDGSVVTRHGTVRVLGCFGVAARVLQIRDKVLCVHIGCCSHCFGGDRVQVCLQLGLGPGSCRAEFFGDVLHRCAPFAFDGRSAAILNTEVGGKGQFPGSHHAQHWPWSTVSAHDVDQALCPVCCHQAVLQPAELYRPANTCPARTEKKNRAAPVPTSRLRFV